MKRLDVLIAGIRAETDNESPTSDTGIQDSSFIRWANRAQEKLQSALLNVIPKPKLFQKEFEQDGSAGEDRYDIPAFVYQGTRIVKLEYSPTGQEQDYYELDLVDLRARCPLSGQSDPSEYIRQSKQIILQPTPSRSGKLRWTYEEELPTLDVRRGIVSEVTLTQTGITSLALDDTDLTQDDIDWMKDQEYITVVDRDGQVKMRAIPITDIALTGGVVSLVSGFEFEEGETIEVGDHVVGGKYATSHSHLPASCERYLEEYMAFRALRKDSSNDAPANDGELKEILAEILESVSRAEAGLQRIPYDESEL